MKIIGTLMMGLLLVFAFSGLADVRADQDYNTGLKYYKGAGVKQDYAEAFKWFQKAADRGNVNAQYNIGVAYGKGKGVTQDYAEAIKSYRKAANQGNAKAQNCIGFMYEQGRGVPQEKIM